MKLCSQIARLVPAVTQGNFFLSKTPRGKRFVIAVNVFSQSCQASSIFMLSKMHPSQNAILHHFMPLKLVVTKPMSDWNLTNYPAGISMTLSCYRKPIHQNHKWVQNSSRKWATEDGINSFQDRAYIFAKMTKGVNFPWMLLLPSVAPSTAYPPRRESLCWMWWGWATPRFKEMILV